MIDFEHYNLKLIKYIKKKFIYFCLDLIKKLVNATICIFQCITIFKIRDGLSL